MSAHTTSTTPHRAAVKAKKSFTLSRSSVAFLERLRKERKAASTSLILDELIREAEARQRRRSAKQAITAYYSGLSLEERDEQKAWGDFALTQLREPT